MSFSGNYNSPDPAMDAENQSPGLGNLFGLLSVTMVLVAFGLNMLYSAGGSDMGVASRLFYNQLAMTVLGVLGGTVVFILSPRFFCKRSLWWLAGCAVLLIWARFSKEVNGAHRWIHVAGHTFQPSELAKIAVAIFVADYCAEHQRTFNTLDPRSHYGMLPLAAGVGIMLLLIVIGKDLGTTLLVAAVAFLTMCVANLKWYFYAVPLALAPVGVLFIRFFDPMRWARMTIYLDPERYKNQEGYQLWNAFMALALGVHRPDVLLLEKDLAAVLLQFPDGRQAVHRVSRPSADALSDDQAELSCQRILHHLREPASVRRARPADSGIGVHACEGPAFMILNEVGEIANLRLVAVFLFLGFCADAGITRYLPKLRYAAATYWHAQASRHKHSQASTIM